jgi:hypothetical protein
VDFFSVSPELIIVSFYAQDRYGREKQHTSYAAFERCLAHLHGEVLTNPAFVGKSVYFPYGIGCGLAGGDWKVIKPLIERYIPESVVVKLNK